MPANAYVPHKPGKLPAILMVHGHWRGAKQDPVVQSRCIGAAKLGFFVLAPLVTLPIVLAYAFGYRAALVAGFLLAYPHYLSTFTFFLWDENRPVHRARWVAFFAGPVLLSATFLALIVFHVPLVLQLVLFGWNAFHVSRQSCGLGRPRAGVKPAPTFRLSASGHSP